MEKEPITTEGLKKLKEELIFLKEKKRPEIVSAIAEARSHGDLKENAEYHAAKEQQSHNEGRIQEIENTIATANIIDVTKINNDGKVIFGKEVRGKQKITIESENGDTSSYLIPKGKHINFNQGEKIKKGEYLLDGQPLPHDILRI